MTKYYKLDDITEQRFRLIDLSSSQPRIYVFRKGTTFEVVEDEYFTKLIVHPKGEEENGKESK